MNCGAPNQGRMWDRVLSLYFHLVHPTPRINPPHAFTIFSLCSCTPFVAFRESTTSAACFTTQA